jgi:hypothetical protein
MSTRMRPSGSGYGKKSGPVGFGTAAKVRGKVDASFVGLAQRTADVMQCYRMELQACADHWLLLPLVRH